MNPWEDVFGEVPASFTDRVQNTLEELEDRGENIVSIGKKTRPVYRTLLIAAVVTVLLVGTALAITISRARIVQQTVDVYYESTGGISQQFILGFEAVGDGPIHLGVWELGSVPEGYERAEQDYRIVDNGANGSERWENARGDFIGFEYQAANQQYDQFLLDINLIAEQTDVSVGGSPGTLFREKNGRQFLMWTNEERGIGFSLSTASEDVDILAVAESVRETGETPKVSEKTAAAVDQLGGWTIGELPEGYDLYFSSGYPGDHAYVYRTYENAGHYKLYLHYEAAVYTHDIDACIAFYHELTKMAYMYGNSYDDDERVQKYTISELEIQGMDARLVLYEDGTPVKVTWMDLEHELVFSLSGDGFGADELIAMAESVTLPPAGGSGN